MKFRSRLLISAAAVGLLASGAPALAQAPAPFMWTGVYGGVNYGYSFGKSSWNYREPELGLFGLPTSFSGTNHLNGPIGGAQAGYNFQAGMWVLGFETDIQASGEKGSSRFGAPYSDCEGGSCNLFGTIHSEIKWFGTARARAGWLVTPTTLVYATGGMAYGEVAAHGSIIDTGCFPTSCTWSFGGSSVNVGYVVGAGFEFFPATLPNFSIKAEYLYMDLGSLSGSGFDSDFGGTYSWSANFTDHIVRMGLNYHLN